MITIRPVFHLYKDFAPVTLLLSLPGLFHPAIPTFGDFLPIKILSNLLVFLYFDKTKADDMVYYYNLNISKTKLWGFAFALDLLLYLTVFSLLVAFG